MQLVRRLLLCSTFSLAAPALAGDTPHWSYAGADGPESWGAISSEFSACGAGTEQSPIDIRNEITAELPELVIDWNLGGTIINNGHTIEIKSAGGALDRGDATYDLLQYHLHAPSEHRINGETADMEIHFVHRERETGMLGVLAVLVRAGEENPMFAALSSAMPGEPGVETALPDLNPRELLPRRLSYWTYEGSLTTPPCSETVSWFITRDFIDVSSADIAAFTRLYPMNARPTASLNRRFVLGSQ